MVWFETGWSLWTLYLALLIGGLVHVFPQILGVLSKTKIFLLPIPLNKKVVRGIQVAAGVVLLVYLLMLLFG